MYAIMFRVYILSVCYEVNNKIKTQVVDNFISK